MKDQISIQRVALLHPKVRQDFQEFIEECEAQFKVTLRIVQGFRSFPEQDALYQIGRTVKGNNASAKHPMGDIVTNSYAGSSYHNYGLAIDIADLEGNKLEWNFDYNRLFNISQQWNITWGGSFTNLKDYDHFEIKLGHNWHDLLAMYNAGKFISGTHYVDI